MNVYCFYFSTACNSPSLVPSSVTCIVYVCVGEWEEEGGVYALLAMVTQIGNTPPPKKKKSVWILRKSSIVLVGPHLCVFVGCCLFINTIVFHLQSRFYNFLTFCRRCVLAPPPSSVNPGPGRFTCLGDWAEGRGIDFICFQALKKKEKRSWRRCLCFFLFFFVSSLQLT